MRGSQIAEKLRKQQKEKLKKERELAFGRYKAFVVDKMLAHRHRHVPRGPYGLSIATREFMLEMQFHCCAICERPFGKKLRPCTDHCHETGKVRAFLCNGCNTGLGLFKDKPDVLRRAADYLEHHVALHRTELGRQAGSDENSAASLD